MNWNKQKEGNRVLAVQEDRILTCPVCGAKFTYVKNKRYCSYKCEGKAYRQAQNEKNAERAIRETLKNAELNRVASEAKQAGMSYGQYVAFKMKHA